MNRKLVFAEVCKLLISVVQRELNNRHYNILHCFALR